MSIRLIFADKKFWPLFWTQFLGALNDNFLKNALVVLITFKGIQLFGTDTQSLVALAGGVFILPFLLFSPLAGQISDRFEKSKIIRITKICEFGIMTIASAGFYFENYYLLLLVLFFMGAQSAFFGPVKYSIIPELVEKDKLIEGNAYVELGTFVAILVGTIAGGLAVSSEQASGIIILGLLGISTLGILISFQLPKVPLASPDLKISFNPFPTLGTTWRLLREQKVIFNTVLGISWFWFFGAGILSVLPVYCKDFLGVNEEVVTAFLAMFTLGIGVGSILCEKMSFGRVEIGLVPIGSIGLSIFLLDLFFVVPPWAVAPQNLIGFETFFDHSEGYHLLIDFFLMSVFGGIFTVPLYTLLQERSHPESRSRVIAGNNIMNALFMVLASALLVVFYSFNFSTVQIFLIFAILNAIVSIHIYRIVPEFTLRFYSWILSHMFYHLKITGLENIPKEGPALLTCNHVSFVDWLIISGAVKRPTRFIMHYKYYEIPLIRYLVRQAGVIPIAGRKENPEILEKSFTIIQSLLASGEVVCIFPEGTITRTGELNPFRPGILKMLNMQPVPVVPMALNNLWGSMFSRKGGPAGLKAPRKLWKVIRLDIAKPIPPENFRLEDLEAKTREMLDPEPGEKSPATFSPL